MALLCNRCEHRAQAIESGHAPRYQCRQIGEAVDSCYMYKPVSPVLLSVCEGDTRLPTGGLLGARMRGVSVAETLVATIREVEPGVFLPLLQEKE